MNQQERDERQSSTRDAADEPEVKKSSKLGLEELGTCAGGTFFGRAGNHKPPCA